MFRRLYNHCKEEYNRNPEAMSLVMAIAITYLVLGGREIIYNCKEDNTRQIQPEEIIYNCKEDNTRQIQPEETIYKDSGLHPSFLFIPLLR